VHSAIPERFSEGMRLFALSDKNARRELKLEALWPHKGFLILKFAGVDSISDAEVLVRCELQVPASERAQLQTGWSYVSDLVGCAVFDGRREIGRIEEVQFGAGEAPLLMVRSGSREYIIPFAEEFLERVDVSGKEVRMRLPEGMLEINEKQ
jgi:16S rRNA processing protein RimM